METPITYIDVIPAGIQTITIPSYIVISRIMSSKEGSNELLATAKLSFPQDLAKLSNDDITELLTDAARGITARTRKEVAIAEDIKSIEVDVKG